MVIETKYGKIAVGDMGHCEGVIYADCDLESVPEALQEHIDKIICENKKKAFEIRKNKLMKKGYRTLEELERDNKIEIETPYIGMELNLRANKLSAWLNIRGHDAATEGVLLEFQHIESIAIDPHVILELLITTARKLAPAEQTMGDAPEDFY